MSPLLRAPGGEHINGHELRPVDPSDPSQTLVPDNLLAGPETYRLAPVETLPPYMVRVPVGRSRPDIDPGALAFFDYSWGGVNGPVALAQEPRFRAAMIDIGLLPPMTATPEVDPVNSLPRVRIPALMLSGEFDPMVPSENSDRYFALIGTPAAHKRHVIAIGGHFVPRHLLIRETLDWLERYLGQVRGRPVNTP